MHRPGLHPLHAGCSRGETILRKLCSGMHECKPCSQPRGPVYWCCIHGAAYLHYSRKQPGLVMSPSCCQLLLLVSSSLHGPAPGPQRLAQHSEVTVAHCHTALLLRGLLGCCSSPPGCQDPDHQPLLVLRRCCCLDLPVPGRSTVMIIDLLKS